MLDYLATQPLIASFLVIIIVTLVLAFAFPSLVKITENTFWNNLSHQARKLKRRLKDHPIQSTIIAVLLVVVLAGGYYLYLSSQSVIYLSGSELKSRKASNLQILEKEGVGASRKAQIYLLDIRSRDEYIEEYILGSASLPAERAKKEAYPMDKKYILVVFGSQNRFDEAKETAAAIIKNGKESGYQGNVFLIKDGFEGLKKAGLKTARGAIY
ncbi:MAG: rhodanese-like domain-containing protein [bacterium]|nr:rhodanese-like domain-containing protein [bacterium]